MTKFRLERVLPYEAAQLWALVGDVEKYPDFIPWITKLRLYNRDGDKGFDADVNVGFKLLSERFSTHVTHDLPEMRVDMRLIKGPFRKLNGRWSFVPVSGGTQVAFDMDVEIKNPILDSLFKANFNLAVSKLMTMFETRAAGLLKPID